MLYARLIADQLASTRARSTLRASARCRRASTRSTRRTFVAYLSMMARGVTRCRWCELMCAAAEPLTVDAASNALGWDRARCKKTCDGVSLLFPLREGDVIGVLHKTVTDWLTGEAPFDKRSSRTRSSSRGTRRTGGWRGRVLGRFVLGFWIRSRTRATPPRTRC